MKHAPELIEAADGLKCVCMRLPVVDYNGLIKLRRELKLGMKQRFLLVLMLIVPVIVEPYLPYCNTFRVCRKRSELIEAAVRQAVQLFRVHSNRSIYKAVFFRKLKRFAAAPDIAARIEHELHPSLRQRSDQCVPVRVKGFVIVMYMCVKIHWNTSQIILSYYSLVRGLLQI